MLLRQSEPTAALRTRMFSLKASDGVTDFTSALSGADVQLSKAGSALGNAIGVATHISAGLYKLVLDTAADLDTLGELVLVIAKTGVQTMKLSLGQVVPWAPYDGVRLGLTALRPDALLVGTAITGTLSQTSFTTNLTMASGQLANEAHLRWIGNVTAALAGQVQKITAYVGGLVTVASPGFSVAPANLDQFVIVNG